MALGVAGEFKFQPGGVIFAAVKIFRVVPVPAVSNWDARRVQNPCNTPRKICCVVHWTQPVVPANLLHGRREVVEERPDFGPQSFVTQASRVLASALRGPLVDVLQPSDEPDEPLAIADVVRMMPVERPDIPQKCRLNDGIAPLLLPDRPTPHSLILRLY